ncbi:Prophage Lp2 protein 13 [Levilactobacillus brevis]|uniref:Prophage Lp2 protein 13 n=1 Tax=Levilactobacillus brevis TaxID=1580 RepID=A0A5B7Y158_LEVBR|nr:helix-turn-helix transcriptional regulator [Levilactobacillus brevis]QCZ53596.1 Prophage Lp2 protein 13 [Levilactobacillus brevis]
MQSKFSEQLTLALDGIQGSLTHKQVAGKVHVSVGQLSRLKNGTRNIDKPTRISLADALQSTWLNFSGAREDYRIPSFMKNKTKHNDVMAALFQQRKEENERRQLEDAFDEAIGTKPELRSPQQQQLIRDYFKEYVEEIGAENTDIVMKAQYAGVQLQSYFDKYNDQYGG